MKKRNQMKIFLLINFLILFIFLSCAKKKEEIGDSDDTTTGTTTGTTGPTLSEVTAIATPSTDTTPDYTFSSSETGTITYGGSCSSETESAISGNNTITLNSLSDGTYSDCTITVTNTSGHSSTALNISAFVIYTQQFIAVGSAGTILNSSDGITWTSRNSETSEDLNRIAYGNGVYYAVGNNSTFAFSVDGLIWKILTVTGNVNINDILYVGNSMFVAVFNSFIIATCESCNTNPKNWDVKDMKQNNFSSDLYGVTLGTYDIVFVGDSGWLAYDEKSTTSAWNGSIWSKNSGTSKNLLDICYGNNTFIAVGDNGTIQTSPENGTSYATSSVSPTWTSRSGTTNTLFDVIYENNIFMTVGDNGTILTSSDGTTWTTRSSGTTKKLSGITYGNSTFMIVGDSGTILTSSDGTTWTTRSSGTTNNLSGVTYSK